MPVRVVFMVVCMVGVFDYDLRRLDFWFGMVGRIWKRQKSFLILRGLIPGWPTAAAGHGLAAGARSFEFSDDDLSFMR